MAIRRIPLPTDVPSFRQRTTLDGVEYVLEMRWSMREEKWWLWLRDANANLLAGPMKALSGFPLLQTHRAGREAPTFPPGELIFRDTRDDPADPVLGELGTDAISLLYIEGAES